MGKSTTKSLRQEKLIICKQPQRWPVIKKEGDYREEAESSSQMEWLAHHHKIALDDVYGW